LWSEEEGKTNGRRKTFNIGGKKQLLLRNFALEFQFFFFFNYSLGFLNWKSVLPILISK
jgi:hypothetical protein